MGSVGILDRLNGLRMDNGWQQDYLFVEYLVVTLLRLLALSMHLV
jgi:hypothetical protein